MSAPKSIPKDAQVMIQILKDMGITEYEPRVINQMLEFTYRYVTTIIEDAKIYATHAKKSTVDADDIKLAIQCRMDQSFTSPPPRDFLLEVARQKNLTPLPLIKPYTGPRLPPDRYCLTAPNYRLKTVQKKVRKRRRFRSRHETPFIVVVVVVFPGDVVGRQDLGASSQHRRRLQPTGHADPRNPVCPSRLHQSGNSGVSDGSEVHGSDPTPIPDGHHQNHDGVLARRLQRAHQPVSDWLQEPAHHGQHGDAERQRVAEEEARGRGRLRRFMTARLLLFNRINTFLNNRIIQD